jgi:hypothetical protein
MKPSKRAQISSVCHTSRLSTPVIITKDFIMQMREQKVHDIQTDDTSSNRHQMKSIY